MKKGFLNGKSRLKNIMFKKADIGIYIIKINLGEDSDLNHDVNKTSFFLTLKLMYRVKVCLQYCNNSDKEVWSNEDKVSQ